LLTVTTRVISSGDLYCCLLPRCEALRICRSGFPIATVPMPMGVGRIFSRGGPIVDFSRGNWKDSSRRGQKWWN